MQSCCALRESQRMSESEKDYHNRVKHIMNTHKGKLVSSASAFAYCAEASTHIMH